MDWLCNKKIPKSTPKTLILKPTSKTFINGMSPSYEIIYFEELKPYINRKEYDKVMERIIEGNIIMWPCDFCLNFGYVCCLCTLGFSFCFPNYCINEATKSFLQDIEIANNETFHKYNLHLSLQKKCCTSWLQIDICDEEKTENSILKNKNENIDISDEAINKNINIQNQINLINNQI
jgi:hypothetical protein